MFRTISVYQGILIRSSLQDDGSVPRTGAVNKSPDIINNGDQQVPDPQACYGNRESYDRYENNDLFYGQNNFIYVRGRNLIDEEQSGRVFLYWAKTADLNYPDRWKGNMVRTTNGGKMQEITAYQLDDIVTAPRAFVWNPELPAEGESLSLVGVIGTDSDPNPVPDLSGTIDFEAWLRDKPGVAWYQFSPYQPHRATFSADAQFDLTGNSGQFQFQMQATNLPIGAIVAFTSSKPDQYGNPIALNATEIQTSNFIASLPVDLDGTYNGRITYTFDAMGKQIADDNQLSMAVYKVEKGTGGPSKLVKQVGYTTAIFQLKT